MQEKDLYKIIRYPDMHSVTPGAIITYECSGPPVLGNDTRTVHWVMYRKISDHQIKQLWDHEMRPIASGYEGRGYCHPVTGCSSYGSVKTYKWDIEPGDYVVFCKIKDQNGLSIDLHFEQHLMDGKEIGIVFQQLAGQAQQNLISPDQADILLQEKIDAIKAIEKEGPPLSDSQKKKHVKEMANLQEYRAKIAERLASTYGRPRFPIVAVHIDYATQEKRQLNFFLARMTEVYDEKAKWRLVDWTNPISRAETSESDGEGITDFDAIRDTFKFWNSWRGRYPPGKIRFEIPKEVMGEPYTEELETDGETNWDTIIKHLSTVATVGGIILIGVATMGAGVPTVAGAAVGAARTAAGFSHVLRALALSSAASGAGAEIINIAQRYAEGIKDTKGDAISVLGIIGSMFQMGWVAGATITRIAGEGAKGLDHQVFNR